MLSNYTYWTIIRVVYLFLFKINSVLRFKFCCKTTHEFQSNNIIFKLYAINVFTFNLIIKFNVHDNIGVHFLMTEMSSDNYTFGQNIK